MKHVRVTNRQQYAIGRAGHVFPPGRTVEVKLNTERQLTEVKACVYLAVEVIDPEIQSKPEMPEYVTKSVNEMKVDELRQLADDLGIEGYGNLKKPELLAVVSEQVEAGTKFEISDEDDEAADDESESEDEDAE